MKNLKKVYLAGPDVFYPEPVKHAEELKRICSNYYLEGLFPLDAVLDLKGLTPPEQAKKIFEANVALIDSADAVLANMYPFRGPSMDIGTGWEMGYAYGKGKIVVGYTHNPYPYKDRAAGLDSLQVEDFELVDNLMVVYGCQYGVSESFFSAVRQLANILGIGGEPPTV